MFALGSGIDNSLNLNVLLNSILDASNKHDGRVVIVKSQYSRTDLAGILSPTELQLPPLP
jgi:hypothetical protein